MATPKLPPLKIRLGTEFWQDELVEKLRAAGHTVDLCSADYDVSITTSGWRVPPGCTVTEVAKYIDMILKQARATKHAQNPPPEKGVTSLHKVPRKRGKKAKGAPDETATDTTKLDDASVEGC